MRQALLGHQNKEQVRPFGFSLSMFEHALDHVHHFRALNGSGAGAITLDTIRSIVCDLVHAELTSLFPKRPHDSYSRELVVEYIVGAYMALLTRWLEEGAKQPSEQIDQIFRRLATKGIDDFRCC